MTFESLALAGLSLGLSYNDLLEMRIGLILGLINEKFNQMEVLNNKEEKHEDVIHGDAKMLMSM